MCEADQGVGGEPLVPHWHKSSSPGSPPQVSIIPTSPAFATALSCGLVIELFKGSAGSPNVLIKYCVPGIPGIQSPGIQFLIIPKLSQRNMGGLNHPLTDTLLNRSDTLAGIE